MIKVTKEQGSKYTYEEYFEVCMNQLTGRVIPIGIYREINPFSQNSTPFIMTSPEKQTLLLEGDIIFVIGETKDNKMRRLN
jgi:ABC-type Fe3+-hydroxamate transport system substrate-binding protein